MAYKHLQANKILEHFQQKLTTIRSSRVSASLLDSLHVEAYGSMMSFREVATVTSPEPAQLMITPFDKSLLNALEKSIQNSNLNVNPTNDGAGLRLVFAPLTEETRKQRVKEVSKLLEEAKIAVRGSRQDLLKTWKHQKDEGEISEDEQKRLETELQKEVENLNKELEAVGKEKEAELMAV